MKTTSLILVIFFFLGTISKSIACSPAISPFEEILTSYNKNEHIIVEGHFLPEVEGDVTAKFKITRSSDSSIQIEQEYEVYQYGPFGSGCEMYQMPSSTPTNLIGNPRLLFLYKDLSENNKLVTPIFREFGAEISNNKIVSPEIDSSGTRMIFSEFPANLDEFWKQVLSGTITSGRKRQYIIEDENRFIQFFKSLIH